MKFIRLNHNKRYGILLSLFFTFFVLCGGKSSKAQVIRDGTRYMKVIHSTTQGPPNDRWGLIDTLNVTYQSADTVKFNLSNKAKFIKTGGQVFQFIERDTVLAFDFDLVAGDTFRSEFYDGEIVLLVDSINSIQFYDGNFYRHWYLTSVSTTNRDPIVWVEGIGEKSVGWSSLVWYNVLHWPSVNAICYNNSVVYWDYSFYGFDPTCSFDSIVQMLDVPTVLGANGIKIQPNPVKKYISFNKTLEGEYVILGMTGVVIQQGDISNQINVEHLSNGTYLLLLSNEYGTIPMRFSKVN
jgi:hypothetical protein